MIPALTPDALLGRLEAALESQSGPRIRRTARTMYRAIDVGRVPTFPDVKTLHRFLAIACSCPGVAWPPRRRTAR